MSLFGSLGRLAGGFLAGGPAGLAAAGLSLIAKKPTSSAAPVDSIITTRNIQAFPPSYQSTQRIYTTPLPSQQPDMYDHVNVMPMVGAAGACPIGHRLNKSTYVTRGGGTSHWPQQLQVHPKGTTCVKRRRRNVGNARALRRAISRVKGFVKLARKAHSLVGGHRSRGKQPGRQLEVIRTG